MRAKHGAFQGLLAGLSARGIDPGGDRQELRGGYLDDLAAVSATGRNVVKCDWRPGFSGRTVCHHRPASAIIGG